VTRRLTVLAGPKGLGYGRTMRRWGLYAVMAFALSAASVIQAFGWTQTSHYALVRALSHGTAVIDPWQAETGDKAWFHGHFYSVKAPGLALVVLPEYLTLKAVHAVPQGLRPAIWELALIGAVLPAVALLLLVRRQAERSSPGAGLLTAGALALGTLLFPFATLLFNHVLAAALVFAAYVVLLHEREAGGSPRYAALAGLLAGAGMLAEYPAAIAAVVLGGLVLAAPRRVMRAAAYAAGFAIPVAILAAYNRWAFGSFTHLSYDDAVIVSGRTGHDVVGAQSHGLFGVTAPSLRVIVDLFVARRGFLVLTPLVAIALVGLVVLFRRGQRLEAAVAGVAFSAFLLYNAGITTTFGGPFGGESPGPRYMVVALPFLAPGLAAAMRSAPGSTAALAAVSVFNMALGTATKPLLQPGEGLGTWLHLARTGAFTDTVLTPIGLGSGWVAIVPFFVLTAAVVALASSALPRPSVRAAGTALVALSAWLLLALTTSRLLGEGIGTTSWTEAGAAVAVAAASVAIVAVTEAGPYLAALGLLPLVLARLTADRPGWVALFGAAAFLVAAGAYVTRAAGSQASPAGSDCVP
jgi:hypothetical protein